MNRASLVLLLIGLTLVSADFVVHYKSFFGNDWTDVDGWGTYNSYRAANIINTCGGQKFIGGRGVFGARSAVTRLIKMPPHHTVQIKFQLWKMDSWDNERFFLWVDDKVVFERAFGVTEGENLCNNVANWNTMRLDVDVKIAHTNPSILVVLNSNLDEHADNESFGFKNFELLIDRCPDNCEVCVNNNQQACISWQMLASSWSKDAENNNDGWQVSDGKDASYNCAGINFYGAFANFGKGAKVTRKFDLPPHYRLKIKAMFFKLDSWDNESGFITVDGEKIWNQQFIYTQGFKICGHPEITWRAQAVNVDAEAAHTKAIATVVISSTLDQHPEDESWGVRDFFLYFTRCASNCDQCSGPAEADCTRCKATWALQAGKCAPLVNFIMLEQSFMEKKFTGVSGWTLEKNVEGRTLSECDGFTLVGGFDIFGAGALAKKSFTIPKHSRVRLQVQMWKIDSWDGEFLFISVDGSKVWQRQLSFASGGQQLCGSQNANWNEIIIDVDEIFVHDAPQLNLVLSSTLDQAANDESWGFREFRLYYEAQQECAVFYSECDYKGASFQFCAESSDFRRDNVPPVIRSVKVPPQGRVTLFEKTDFGGKKVTFSESQPCINNFEFSFLQLKYEQDTQWEEV